MSLPLKTVAVLIANPALSSILSMALAAVPSLRVRSFETEAALRSYLHVADADLVVVDFDGVPGLAGRLRSDVQVSNHPQIVALVSELTTDAKAAAMRAGIDETIIKPMSPRYLVERVLARLARAKMHQPAKRVPPRDWSTYGSNIVPLFQRSPATTR